MNNAKRLPPLSRISQAKALLSTILQDQPGVEGVGIMADEAGTPIIVVYVNDEQDLLTIPSTFEGFQVVGKAIGRAVALQQYA